METRSFPSAVAGSSSQRLPVAVETKWSRPRRGRDPEPAGRWETMPITGLRATCPRMRAGTPALPGEGALPFPRVEMRSSSSAEPAGRRVALADPSRQSARYPDAGGDARAPRARATNPTPGDALVVERCRRLIEPATTGRCRDQVVAVSTRARSGARMGPGGHAYPSHQSARPKMRAGTPALPGRVPPIPRLETRSSSSAEPGWGRGIVVDPSCWPPWSPDAGGDARAPRG
jgi:hypothetical protein